MILYKQIRKRREELHMSQEELASLVGYKSRSSINKIEMGKNDITQSQIAAFAKALRTTPSYLMGWEDDTFDIFSIPGINPPPKTYKVPRLGTIACGTPIMAIENIDSYDDIPNNIHCDFTLLCQGDSMVDVRINDGDVVYIREQQDVNNGEIAAVLIDNEATLKKVYKQKNRLILRAANPNYEDLEYQKEQLNDIRIIGKVIGFTSFNVQ